MDLSIFDIVLVKKKKKKKKMYGMLPSSLNCNRHCKLFKSLVAVEAVCNSSVPS